MKRLDAAFFRVGAARGGTLVKYQLEEERMPSLEEVRAEMMEMGLEVDHLEDEGRLRFVSDKGGSEGRVNEVRRLAAESSEGDRTLWANFNWDLSMGVDEALDQQRLLTNLVEDSKLVVNTAVFEENLDDWPGETQRRAQVTHTGTIWLSREGLAISRVTPPPAL
jgi:hypothetical protein